MKFTIIASIFVILCVASVYIWQTKYKGKLVGTGQQQTTTAPTGQQASPGQSGAPPQQFRDPYKDMTIPQDEKK